MNSFEVFHTSLRSICDQKMRSKTLEHLSMFPRQFFPCVQRLIISLNTRRQMTILIDRFKHLSSTSFFVKNCQINTAENLREPQVTREWFIENTHRLSRNHNFICQIDYQYRSWIHLWIGDCENRSKVKKNSWLRRCFPRCLSDTTKE